MGHEFQDGLDLIARRMSVHDAVDGSSTGT
jgi:hypothetical protein